ncbi:acyl-CoA thioesterase [Bacillus pinisoli]|uniref:acyl-CoA thioesterase n=1 Tax=Bacillus pinisoli TaxID=2901866 RepID=UPI001FF4E3A8|nr:thioesterase family protein [Bacillus pinisoli]
MNYEIEVVVRFGETDALGHVNNASYFVYLEEARVRFFQELGYPMETKNWNFILASTKCDFVDQAYFSQALRIITTVSHIGTKSFTLHHDIVDSLTKKVIAKGTATIVYFDFHEQKSAPIPESLRNQLEGFVAIN